MAQAVSRWLPTAAARVRSQVNHAGFVVDKVALGQVFSEYFGFPCQSSFHHLLHNHHLSSGAGTIGQQWPTYEVDSVSPHREKLKKKKTDGSAAISKHLMMTISVETRSATVMRIFLFYLINLDFKILTQVCM
jgi:hypothetical protein